MFNTPVLFIIFNRLRTAKEVFSIIRQVKPKQLYIAADGPRNSIPDELIKCNTVRNYVIESIDWSCSIHTLFREKNLGCGEAVSKAVTWFFENVKEGIILEDDCVPSISFFGYCENLLEKYRNNERIFHISGNNPLTISSDKNNSYYFARIQHCWGWATWRRAWEYYSFDISDYQWFKESKIIEKTFDNIEARNYWIDIFNKIEKHSIDTWDYQWTYAIIKQNGYCINPTRNLVTNIGFGTGGTHTFDSSSVFFNQKRFEIEEIIHSRIIKFNNRFVNKINEISFGIIRKKIVVYALEYFRIKFSKIVQYQKLKRTLIRIFKMGKTT